MRSLIRFISFTIGIVGAGYIGYQLGKNRTLDVTKNYVLKKVSSLANGINQVEYLKLENNQISFVSDYDLATPLNYSVVESAMNFIKNLNNIGNYQLIVEQVQSPV